MSRNHTREWRRLCALLLATVLGAVGTALGLAASAAPASAHGSCPRPDRASNLIIFQPGRLTATFPGSRSADYCDGAPAYDRTELWPGAKPTTQPSVSVPGGTWTVRDDGRLTFRVSGDARVRPEGDRSPGHDVIMKYSIVDTKGHYQSGIALAYVVYPGASAFADTIETCGDGIGRPLANDVPGWRGSNRYDKEQATLRPETLRLADAGTGNQVVTDQGTWQVMGQGRVRFVPKKGWTGVTAPLRYSVRDTFGNTASSTITARTCGAKVPPARSGDGGTRADPVAGTMKAAPASAQAQDTGPDGRTWLPLGLAALCLLVGGLVLRSRRGSNG